MVLWRAAWLQASCAERPGLSERTVGCKVVEITEALPVIVASGEGEKLSAFGEEVIFHLGGVQTGGKIALWIHFVSP